MIVRLKKTITATAMVAALVMSQQVFAHAHLTSAVPADKAVVSESPKSLSLTFTEGIEPAFSGVELMAADGGAIATGKATVDSADTKVLTVPLTTPLKAGEYMVDWHALSVDGHKTTGSYNFTVK